MPTYLQMVPYLRELDESVDAALYQLSLLEARAQEWIALDESLAREVGSREFNREAWQNDLQESATKQSHIFDAIEAFLAVWMRISQLIFPTVKSAEVGSFKDQRAKVLQDALALEFSDRIANRDLRDAWMHVDERLDEAVQAGVIGNRQRFMRGPVQPRDIETSLRLINVDSLDVHFRGRGSPQKYLVANLRDMGEALRALRDGLPEAYARLRTLASPPAA